MIIFVILFKNSARDWEEKRRFNPVSGLILLNLGTIAFNVIWKPTCIIEEKNCKSSWHLFVIRVKTRDHLKNYLKNNGIDTLIHYPIPPHKQKAFSEWNNLTYIITERIHNEVLSIPLYPNLSEKDKIYIVEALNKY